ncbi:MAG: hypothetical protein ACOY5V_01125 [Pseudomonadota bacterium]
MKLESSVKDWSLGAQVHIEYVSDGYRMTRAAAFVYDAPNGFAFISPSYRDPWGGSHVGHVIEATLVVASDGRFDFEGPRYRGTIEKIEEETEGDAALALYQFVEELRADGLTWEGERERLRPSTESKVTTVADMAGELAEKKRGDDAA